MSYITSLNSLAWGSMFKPVVPSSTCRISCEDHKVYFYNFCHKINMWPKNWISRSANIGCTRNNFPNSFLARDQFFHEAVISVQTCLLQRAKVISRSRTRDTLKFKTQTYVQTCHIERHQNLALFLFLQPVKELLRKNFKITRELQLLTASWKFSLSSRRSLPDDAFAFSFSATTISQPTLSAHISNWSLAAALNVSPAPSST